MSPKQVGDALEVVLGRRVAMNPHGFELRTDDRPPRRARLMRGSGIAGRGGAWMLVLLPGGKPIVGDIRTRAKLGRAVLEFMAGPPPTPISDYTVARAKRIRDPRTGADHFAWVRRMKKRPLPRVALVPFGAAQR